MYVCVMFIRMFVHFHVDTDVITITKCSYTKVRLSFEEVWTCKKPVCHHSQQQISKAGPSFVQQNLLRWNITPSRIHGYKSCVRLDTPPPKAHVQKTLFNISHGLKDFFKIRCFVCFPLLATGFNIASSKTIQMWQSTLTKSWSH